MANYSQELAQDAAYQSRNSRLTELCSLPKPAQGLNTYNNIFRDTRQWPTANVRASSTDFHRLWNTKTYIRI